MSELSKRPNQNFQHLPVGDLLRVKDGIVYVYKGAHWKLSYAYLINGAKTVQIALDAMELGKQQEATDGNE